MALSVPSSVFRSAFRCLRLGAQDIAWGLASQMYDPDRLLEPILKGVSIRQILGGCPSQYLVNCRSSDIDRAQEATLSYFQGELDRASWIEERDGPGAFTETFAADVADARDTILRMCRSLNGSWAFRRAVSSSACTPMTATVEVRVVDGVQYTSMLRMWMVARADGLTEFVRFVHSEGDPRTHLIELGLYARAAGAVRCVLVNSATLTETTADSPEVREALDAWNDAGRTGFGLMLPGGGWRAVPRPNGNKLCKRCPRVAACDAADRETKED